MTSWRTLLTAALSVLLLAACATSDPPAAIYPTVEPGRGWLSEVDDDRSGAAGVDGARELDASFDAPTTMSDAAGEVADPEPTSAGLRAGSVDDNDRWGDYLRYREEFATFGIEVLDLDVRERHVVTVVDRAGLPLLGAVVRSGEQRKRTFADGRALLHGPLGGDIEVELGDATATVAVGDRTAHRVQLDAARSEGPTQLDLHFLIDTTGSMGDEIERLTASVESIARRIGDLPSAPDLHLGMTLYRDRDDVYVTRTFDLGPDIEAFAAALAEVGAAGGGDYAEDLAAGLDEALQAPAWRGDDAIKLVVLVADAPPQLGYDGPSYLDGALLAAERGVKIAPVASSGLDDQGEYVFRQLAQLTMSRFTFLTYGADGASPGDSTPHHVSDYAVLSLDDLIVRLVEDELAGARSGGQ